MYVAVTRAKDALHLIAPVRFYTQEEAAWGDKHVHTTRSRFLPRHVGDKFDEPSLKSKDGEAGSWHGRCRRETSRTG